MFKQHYPKGFARILSVTALLFIQLTNSEPASGADGFSEAELLNLPHVETYITGPTGEVAWVERVGASTHLLLAKAPSYTAVELLSYDEDDGVQLRLIGFSNRGEVLFVRGRPGFNPAHTAVPQSPALLAVDDSGSTRTILATLERGESSFILNASRQALLFARRGSVFRLPLQQGSEPEMLFSVRGGVTTLLPSPDGRKLAFVSNRSGYDRGKYSFAGVFDLASREVTYLEPGLGFDQYLVWSPDSDRVAFIRFGYEPRTWRFSNHREGAPFDVMVVDASSGRGQAVFTSQPGYGSRFSGLFSSGYSGLGGASSLLWMADNRLVFPYEKSGWKQLYSVAASGGSLERLHQGQFEVNAMALSADRRTVYYLANSEDDLARLGLYSLSLNEEMTPSRVSFGADQSMPFSVKTLATGGLAYQAASGSTPASLMVAPSAASPMQLSSGPKPGDPITDQLPAPEIAEFTARDGLTIQMVVYRPAEVFGERAHAAVVHSHGGSRSQVYPVWRTGFGYPAVLPYLASRGYFVFSVNFRSGTGYGLDFREPDSYGGRGAGDIYDFLDAAEYIADNYPQVDPTRMAIYGHSYGGHNVTNALARSDLYAAGVSSAGVSDWVVEMEKDSGEVLQFNVAQRQVLEKQAHESSAISLIDEWGDEPLLLLHGDNDSAAAMQQSLELYHALRRRGKPVEAVVFPGEAHSIARYESRLRYMQAMEEFLERHIGSNSSR